MSITQALIKEIEQESKSTRSLLERIPADKYDWKPHEKSMSMKSLAKHIADLAGMTAAAVKTEFLDFMESNGPKVEINSNEDLLNHFDQGTKATLDALNSINDANLDEIWTMRAGDHIIMEAPRKAAIRSMGLNHLYHHRAQLGVYLRLLDVSIPGMYGPSADDRA